jgi:hypothetical protein
MSTDWDVTLVRLCSSAVIEEVGDWSKSSDDPPELAVNDRSRSDEVGIDVGVSGRGTVDEAATGASWVALCVCLLWATVPALCKNVWSPP